MKRWDELGADEKLLAEKLPAAATTSRIRREKHRFCTRCWFEDEGAGGPEDQPDVC